MEAESPEKRTPIRTLVRGAFQWVVIVTVSLFWYQSCKPKPPLRLFPVTVISSTNNITVLQLDGDRRAVAGAGLGKPGDKFMLEEGDLVRLGIRIK